MKKIIIFTLIFLPIAVIAQSQGIFIYLICTSVNTEYNEMFTVNRGTLPKDIYLKNTRGIDIYKYPPISFHINTSKGSIRLSHYNYNLEEFTRFNQTFSPEEQAKRRPLNNSAPPQMEIIEKPASFLKKIEYIDLDQFLRNKPTDEQLWELGDRLKGQKIYMIDRNDDKEVKIKLIEVEMGIYYKPDPPKKLLPPTPPNVITFDIIR